MRRALAWASLIVLSAAAGAQTQTIRGRGGITLPPPPAAEARPVTDNYNGQKIVDNYRWLEDAGSPETQKFIRDENAYTTRYMQQARIRSQVFDDLDALEQTDTWTIPVVRGDNYYFEKRLAGEDQGAIYIRVGWQGKDKRLIDPAQFSRDADTSVSIADISRDGNLIAYKVRQGGADETTLQFFDVKANKPLLDELPSALYQSVVFKPDGKGVFYTRTDQKGTLLYQHLFGERRDTLLFGREFRGEELGPIDLFQAWVTDDGHYLVVEIDRGVPARRVDIVYRDLTKQSTYFDVLTWGIDSRFTASYDHGAWYVETDYHAPNGTVYKADPGIMPEAWTQLVPEGADPIENFDIVGDKIYVNRLHNVKTETDVYSLTGKAAGKIEYETIGTSSGVLGRAMDRYGFLSFESFTVPPAIYRLDTTTGKRDLFAQSKVPFDSTHFDLKQVTYKSKDGTEIPMFIAGPKDAKQDGTERLLMFAYGGFDLSQTPRWNPEWAWWLQQGGWFALPNLRGGGEFGEKWHEQGMFEKKQNVFDDFFAAAEYLIQNKYTSPEHFGITGRSNGGLLMGAAITQRPELFSAVVCGYPLLDMLRYQKFEQGAHWTTEYGASNDSDQFPYLLKYSPYQNVKKSSAYPAVLFFTGSADTRVDPLHARKMTALLQASSTSGRPVLLHYGLSDGHSSGVSLEQEEQDTADQLSFLWTETGQPPAVRK